MSVCWDVGMLDDDVIIIEMHGQGITLTVDQAREFADDLASRDLAAEIRKAITECEDQP